MRVIVPGHLFALDNLKTGGETLLQFYQDPEIHGTLVVGPSTQEVIRACLSRIRHVEQEKPWTRNSIIIQRGREMLAEMEMRALYYKVAKGELDIEELPIGKDGHIQWLR